MTFTSDKSDQGWHGYIYAVALFLVTAGQIVSLNYYFNRVQVLCLLSCWPTIMSSSFDIDCSLIDRSLECVYERCLPVPCIESLFSSLAILVPSLPPARSLI